MTDANETPELTAEQKRIQELEAAVQEMKDRAVAQNDEFEARIKEMEAKSSEVTRKQIKQYEGGDVVEVIKNGSWVKGFVNSTDKKLGLLYVHTDQGPTTIAHSDNIRMFNAD